MGEDLNRPDSAGQLKSRIRGVATGVLFVAAALWVGYVVWKLWPINVNGIGDHQKLDLLIKTFGGLLVLGGLWLNARRISAANLQAKAALKQADNAARQVDVAAKQVAAVEDGQVTERFSRAVTQLGAIGHDGEPAIEVRLGGIYALARIADRSDRDHWPVVEILAAYVRENAPVADLPKGTAGVHRQRIIASGDRFGPRSDVQAALTILAKRKWLPELGAVDLSDTNLVGATLSGGRFPGADFSGACLQDADLHGAHLKEANLLAADLRGASLSEASLQMADLCCADFEDSALEGTRLSGAVFRKRLVNEDVERKWTKGLVAVACNLTKAQLATAIIDEHTVFPEYLEQYKEELLKAQRGREEERSDCFEE